MRGVVTTRPGSKFCAEKAETPAKNQRRAKKKRAHKKNRAAKAAHAFCGVDPGKHTPYDAIALVHQRTLKRKGARL
jgi:hypothetical protein